MSFSNWTSTNQELAQAKELEAAHADLDEQIERLSGVGEAYLPLRFVYQALVDIQTILKARA